MPLLDLHLSTPLTDSFRVRQITGLFDLPLPTHHRFHIQATLPDAQDNWQIAAITGPSATGKSTLARHAYPGSAFYSAFSTQPSAFPQSKPLIDCFPTNLPIKQITRTLTAVGFSSPPSLLKPYSALSTGQQFRATLAAIVLNAIDKETRRQGDKDTPIGDAAPPSEQASGTGSWERRRPRRHLPHEPAWADGELPEPPNTNPPVSPDSAFSTQHSALTPASSLPLLIIDEFAAPLDPLTAQYASRALSKSIRSHQLPIRLLVITGRSDLLPHLAPDWIFDTTTLTLTHPPTTLPPLDLQVRRSTQNDWPPFAEHHYLSSNLHPNSLCFTGYIDNAPATFTAVIPFPHPIRPGYREHRTVVLPTYQGIGLGSAMSDYIASLFAATTKPYFSRTSHPAMIHHRLHSPHWKLLRPPGMVSKSSPSSLRTTQMSRTLSRPRLTTGFEYTGPPRPQDARRFNLPIPP